MLQNDSTDLWGFGNVFVQKKKGTNLPLGNFDEDAGRLVETVKEEELRRRVELFSGLRHGQKNPAALETKRNLLEEHLREFGYLVSRDPFRYMGAEHHNIVVTVPGKNLSLTPFLVGAHFDAAVGSPGADDNASAVAALLAVARVLIQFPPRRSVRFVGFNLEEPQGPRDWRCRHGSRHFARKSFLRWDHYAGVFILESVGYTSSEPDSQRLPLRLPIPVPDTGDFLAVAGNRRAQSIMEHFVNATRNYVPELRAISHWFPLAGRLTPMVRASDHAPFWDYGYPAVMLTDTAHLRNPNYHQPTDTPNTLDYSFLTQVTRALTATLATG